MLSPFLAGAVMGLAAELGLPIKKRLFAALANTRFLSLLKETGPVKFFVPHAADEEEALRVWDSVRAFLLGQGMPTEEGKVWKISFRHNGKHYSEEVGKIAAHLREEVLVILRAKAPQQLYYVCTANRGVVRGIPYLVGIDYDTHATDFERDE